MRFASNIRQLIKRWTSIEHARARPYDTVDFLAEHFRIGLAQATGSRDRYILISSICTHHNALYNFERLVVCIVGTKHIRKYIWKESSDPNQKTPKIIFKVAVIALFNLAFTYPSNTL